MVDPEDYGAYTELSQEILWSAPQSWFARNWLSARKLSDTTLHRYLIGYDIDRHAIVIPYLNALGEVRSIRWRNLNQGGPKYLQPKGETLHLFRVNATRKPKVWITEGEFDCMVLDQAGFPAVGVPGVNGFKPEWAYLFAYCDQVTVVFDGDEPGREGARRITTLLGPFVDKLRMVKLPQDKDVNDLYSEDRAALVDLVS